MATIMAKIAVLGGGSLGLLLAGRLTASGCECVLWTRSPEQAALLNAQGLTLEDQAEQTSIQVGIHAVPILDVKPFKEGPVLIAVKQTALTSVFLKRLAVIIPDGSTLVLFQNGVGHVELARQALPGRHILTAVTTEGALRIDATTVRHTGRGDTRMGEWQLQEVTETKEHTLPANENAASKLLLVQRLLKQAGFSVLLSKQLRYEVLHKLLINAVINPLTALLRIRNGELTASNDRVRLMKALFDETFDILSIYGIREPTELWDKVLQVCAATKDNESSMLQDVTSHKETEIEFINGAICRMAEGQGRAAPWNEAITALVKATH
jgi:2-dehydropantoate 2-reductase